MVEGLQVSTPLVSLRQNSDADLNLYSHQIIEYFYGILATRPMNRTRAELGLQSIHGFHPGAKWAAKDATPSIHCYRFELV